MFLHEKYVYNVILSPVFLPSVAAMYFHVKKKKTFGKLCDVENKLMTHWIKHFARAVKFQNKCELV